MATKEIKSAYIRDFQKSRQCDLRFWLTVTHEKYGTIDEEIRALCHDVDNVRSLLTHIENDVIKLLEDKEDGHVIPKEVAMEMNISLTRNDEEFASTMTCKELFQYKNKIKFRIFGITYRVIVNAPLVFQLTIPKHIFANTCVRPRLNGILLHKALCKYTWSRSLDLLNWTEIFYEDSYNTTDEDLGYYLKLTLVPYSIDRIAGPVTEAISETKVETSADVPQECPYKADRKMHTELKLKGRNIRVISYNILAERYTAEEQFKYCDPKYLSIHYRKQLIFKELMGYKGDIICLQEVDQDHYHTYFKGHFKNNGYFSMFHKKGDMIPEGLLLAFDRNRFKKLDNSHIVLSKEVNKNRTFKDIKNLIWKRKEVRELFMKQHTSLLVTTLKSIETNNVLIVANTHLYYHYEAPHIRVLQTAVALKYIKQLISNTKEKENAKVSVIFCGDFNSRADTAVYQFLSRGKIGKNNDNLERIGECKSKLFEHDLEFFSACGTPKFTNYTEDFKGCLDYIFCQRHIKLIQSVPFPPEEELAREVALPNKYFPSDHIALVADLEI